MNPLAAHRRHRAQRSGATLDPLFAAADRGRTAHRELSAADFRARVEERLRCLEAELGEVKSRLNGLLFLAAGTVLAQIVLRLFHR
jgi:hypothetical protein